MSESNETRTNIELMPGFSRDESTSGTKVTFYWYSGLGNVPSKIFEVLFFLGGLATTIYPLSGITRLAANQGGFFEYLMPILFVLIGFLIVYRGFSLAINRSVFHISSFGLKARHGPLPFPGAARLDLRLPEIVDVEWQKIGHVNQTGYASGRAGSGYSTTFNVVINTTAGKSITLLSGIRAREYAFAIAGELARLCKNQ